MDTYIENKGSALACGLVLLYIGSRTFYLLCTNGIINMIEIVILNIIVISKAFNMWYLRRKLGGDESSDQWYAPTWWKGALLLIVMLIVTFNLIMWITIWFV